MKSATRRRGLSLLNTKNKFKKLKVSKSPESKKNSNDESDSSENSKHSVYMECSDDSSLKDGENEEEYKDSDSSKEIISKKSKFNSIRKVKTVKEWNKSKSLKKAKVKHSAKEEKENQNTNIIPKAKLIVEDDDDDSDMNEEDEREEESDKEVSFLPCREEEQRTIYNYIKEGLKTTGAYSSLYIAGMPGTGKTASLLTVIKKLQYEASHTFPQSKKSFQAIPSFNSLYLNGMKIPNPSAVFKIIHNHLFSEQRNQNVKKYIQVLDNFFRNRDDFNYKTTLKDIKNSHVILIVDEVDCLINQKQNLLYNIFNWTTYNRSKLIVISISNTLDLPNRLLPKIQSRMGTNKLMFVPYAKNDLYKIISVKIEDVDLFSEDSLKYSCVKVAAINGDLRRLLLISKRAKELFFREREKNKTIKKIEKRHIIQACRELFDSKLVNVIQSLQLLEKTIIATILYQMKDEKDVKVKVGDVYQKKDIFLKEIDFQINWEEFTAIIFNLVSLKIISFAEGFKENFVDNYICIKFYTDEFMNGVEKDDSFKGILELLQSFLNNEERA